MTTSSSKNIFILGDVYFVDPIYLPEGCVFSLSSVTDEEGNDDNDEVNEYPLLKWKESSLSSLTDEEGNDNNDEGNEHPLLKWKEEAYNKKIANKNIVGGMFNEEDIVSLFTLKTADLMVECLRIEHDSSSKGPIFTKCGPGYLVLKVLLCIIIFI
jgi:hypothetical protein